MRRRVVVTGMGAVTPIGIGVEAFWAGIRQGKVGFAPVTRFDTSNYKCKLAAEVKDFQPEKYMDRKAARRMELFCASFMWIERLDRSKSWTPSSLSKLIIM
ncbi:MAG: hypothetical protein HFH87_13730, partial [Lachnospiraceae bacterium]|nr:hypothetical protein [Lachnospiraceae bacterium]